MNFNFNLSTLSQATILETLPPQHADYLVQQDQLWQLVFQFYGKNYEKDCSQEVYEENNNINPVTNVYYISPLAEKNDISVQQIRAVTEWGLTIAKQENEGAPAHKWIIIDCLEKLTLNSANCLLKILEEPPEFLSFLLLTHKLETTLMTIRSRCQIIRYGDTTDYLTADHPLFLNTLFEDLPRTQDKVCSWVKKNKPVYADLIGYLQKIAISQSTSNTVNIKLKWLDFYRGLYDDCENISFFNQGSLSKELSCEQLLFKYCAVFKD